MKAKIDFVCKRASRTTPRARGERLCPTQRSLPCAQAAAVRVDGTIRIWTEEQDRIGRERRNELYAFSGRV